MKEKTSLAIRPAPSARARFALTSLLLAAGLVVHSPWTAYAQGDPAKLDRELGDHSSVRKVDGNTRVAAKAPFSGSDLVSEVQWISSAPPLLLPPLSSVRAPAADPSEAIALHGLPELPERLPQGTDPQPAPDHSATEAQSAGVGSELDDYRDPVLQEDPAGAEEASAATAIANFDGLGDKFRGPDGTFTVTALPPDANGDVGPSHYVQVVNTSIAVFDKNTTQPVLGPISLSQWWRNAGVAYCLNEDDIADPIVQFDQLANRWVIATVTTRPDAIFQHLCVVVSTSGDPTGSYWLYRFEFNSFPDYPKLGVWPDAYYLTAYDKTHYGGGTFLGVKMCALDRLRMLSGSTAQVGCVRTSDTFQFGLPSDLDGSVLPPPGTPNYIVTLDNSNRFDLWKFRADFRTTPPTTTLDGPIPFAGIAPFQPMCGLLGCVPQPLRGMPFELLSALGDRLMYRLAYRNFGSYDSLVFNHSVVAATTPSLSGGVRWYEIRNPATQTSPYQQGTYAGPAPDGFSRWMGSAAMDRVGNLLVGFSISDFNLHPSIRVAGRVPTDTPGTLSQEISVFEGTGIQTNSSRWGDYTSMVVDPTDDCTFWYTNQYRLTDGYRNWRTRISSYRFPSCNPPAADFSLSLDNQRQTAQLGDNSHSPKVIVSVNVTGPDPGSRITDLSISGLPAGVTARFDSPRVNGSSFAAMTISLSSSAPYGTFPYTITGRERTTGLVRYAAGSVTVAPVPFGGVVNGDFESTLDGWTLAGEARITSATHGGHGALQLGGSSQYVGGAAAIQTITVPSGGGTLDFWYRLSCAGSDRARVSLWPSGPPVAIVEERCGSLGWTRVTHNLSPYAGQNVRLLFVMDDYNDRGLHSTMWVDDVLPVGPVPEEGLADLAVLDLSVQGVACAGQMMAIGARIRNQGTARSPASRVNFNLYGSVCEVEHPPLGPGAEAPVSCGVRGPDSGVYYLFGEVDIWGVVTESDEDNNVQLVPGIAVASCASSPRVP